MREKVLTRVDIDNRRANIHDINIVFADAEEKIVDIVRITAENATTNPSIDAETTGLVSADFETGDISYHIGTTDMESKEFTDIVPETDVCGRARTRCLADRSLVYFKDAVNRFPAGDTFAAFRSRDGFSFLSNQGDHVL